MEEVEHYADLQDFQRWRKERSCMGIRWSNQKMVDCQFMPTNEIDNYLDKGTIKRLLRISKASANPDMILNKYKRVFCILLTLERAKLIDYFYQYDELEDAKLPFHVRPSNFPLGKSEDDLWKLFSDTQWYFCAQVMLDKCPGRIYPDNALLPITEKVEIGKGGSAKIYKIEVHEAYNLLESNADPCRGPFALKHFIGRDARKNYRREVEGFKRLMQSPEMPKTIVGFYGSFSQAESYNIILEYADGGTLERYFRETRKPQSPAETLKVWEALFGLLEGLHTIHGLQPTNPEYAIFPGWHQDIKPENILVSHTQDGSICFKLADMGNCHFLNEPPSKGAKDTDSRGTRTYGAPECYRGGIEYLERSTVEVTQKADIWSLGCVYSEAAAWILGGSGQLQTYRNRRRENRSPNFTDDDCFHDGENISSAVRTMHKKLMSFSLKHDYVTSAAIDQIGLRMLADRDLRSDALQLSKVFREVLDGRPSSPYSSEYNAYPSFTRSPQGIPPEYLAEPSVHSPHNMISRGILNDFPVTPMSPQRSSLPKVLAIGLSQSQILKNGQIPLSSTKGDGEISDGGGLDIHSAPVIPEGRPDRHTTQNVPPPSKNPEELPKLDFQTAKQWRIDCKNRVRPLPQLPDLWALKRLEGRDHVFIIDNSETMSPHWNDVTELFEVLSYMVKRTDPDGIELLFTGTTEIYKERHTSKLIKKVQCMPREGKADMKTTLSRVLYKDSLRWSRTPTSVYVFTDGIWESETDCRKPIKDVVTKLEQHSKPTYHLGLQFISFGTDAVGLSRLRSLDEEDKLPRDIVDTEPFKSGNIWKMLLGGLNDTFDKQNERQK